jgi:hypothetical protein
MVQLRPVAVGSHSVSAAGGARVRRGRGGIVLATLLCAGCAIPDTIETLGDRSPPPEFGRPGWVRTSAGVGAWVGGILGGVVSIVTLPITWPLSQLAGDGLGEYAAQEFLLFPAMTGATIGHALFGTPPDVLDYVFRRAWTEPSPPLTGYEFVPLNGPVLPAPAPPLDPTTKPPAAPIAEPPAK